MFLPFFKLNIHSFCSSAIDSLFVTHTLFGSFNLYKWSKIMNYEPEFDTNQGQVNMSGRIHGKCATL